MPILSLSLFHQHYKVAYQPRGLTSWLFFVVSLLIVLVIPVIIGFVTQNFWAENRYFYQSPDVAFTNRCALKVRTLKGRDILWTCNQGFDDTNLAGTDMGVLPFFSFYEDGTDESGRYSILVFTLSVPLGEVDASVYAANGLDAESVSGTRDAVESVTFLPEFVYRINHYLVKLNMTAAPLLKFTRTAGAAELAELSSTSSTPSAASGGPLCALTEADLLLHTTGRLTGSSYTQYTGSPLQDSLRQPADVLDLDNFARYYTSRNLSVVPRVFSEVTGGLSLLVQPPSFAALTNPDTVASSTLARGLWEDLDGLNSFTWKIYLRVLTAQVFHTPSTAESLKWAWVQYLALAYIIQWVLWWLRGVIVTQGLIDTKATYSTREFR